MAKPSKAARDPIYREELARIWAAVLERGYGDSGDRRHKQIYTDENVHMAKDEWSRKWRGLIRFTYAEEERLRLFLGMPRGWPRAPAPESEATPVPNGDRPGP